MSDEPQLPISDIEIENFRGIKHLKISDFKRVNLFVGKNNSGKSTVLESLYLLTAFTKAQLQTWATLLKARNPIYDELYWDALHHHFDSKQKIKIRSGEIHKDLLPIEVTMSGSALRLSISKRTFLKRSDKVIADRLTTGASLERAIEMAYEHPGFGDAFTDAQLQFDDEKNKIEVSVSRSDNPNRFSFETSFLSTLALKEILDSLASDFDEFQDAKLISLLSDTVRPIEPNIRDFRMSSKRAVKADIASIPKLIPVNLLGDGMVRILGIVMKIANTKGGVVLIDEIESGFHYSTLETMWKAVFEAAKKFNVQIFATTHSKECLEAFARIESNDDDRRLFRLSKKENETRVIPYTRENLAASFEIEVEVR
jgi:AAA15 family ATPase/GTPase